MLLTAVGVFIFLALNLVVGNRFAEVLSRKFEGANHSLFQSLLLGFTCISTWLNVWSFFFPVTFYALIPIVVFSFFIYRYSSNTPGAISSCIYHLFRTRFAFITVPIFIVLVAYALLPPQHGDSPGYHFLSIRWIENYRIVPGLANLHGRFGFNSPFFVSSAAFAFTQLTGQSLYVLNIVFVFGFYLWLLNKAYFYKNAMWSLVFLFVAITMFRQLLVGISSPTPDVLTTVIISYVFITLAEAAIAKKVINEGQKLILLLLICFAFTVKLNSFPLVLIAMFLIVQDRLYKSRRALVFMLIAGAIIILPWLIRTYILTGYLVYPAAATGIFNPDWKVPLDVLRFEKLLINNGPKMIPFTWEDADALSFVQWFPLWIKSNISNGLMASLIVLGIAVLSVLSTIVIAIRKHLMPLLWLAVISFISIAFWLYNSPDYRFGYSYIINAILLLILFITHNKSGKLYARRLTSIAIIILCIHYATLPISLMSAYPISTYVVKPLQVKGYDAKNSLSSYPHISLNKKVWLYTEDETHWCNMSPLPCYQTHYTKLLVTQIQLRGDKIEDGFRIKR